MIPSPCVASRLLSVAILCFLSIGVFSYETSTSTASAAAPVTASANNPYRAKLSAGIASQIDQVVKTVLARGAHLSQEKYIIYLTNISNGIQALGQKPVYASNPEITNIIRYLQFEIDNIKSQLSSGSLFVDELAKIVSAGSSSTTTSTSSPTTTTSPTPVSTTPPATTSSPTPVVTTPPVTTASPMPVVITQPTCTFSQYKQPDGSCGECPSGTIMNAARNECIQPLGQLPTGNAYILKHDRLIYFKIGKELGYQSCAIAYTEDAVPFSISTSGGIAQWNANFSSITKSADGNFEWSSLFSAVKWISPYTYVNIYCTKTASRTDEERIFPITQLKDISTSPITTIALYKIDGTTGIRADQYIANGPSCIEVTKDTCARVIQARWVPSHVTWFTEERNFYWILEWKSSGSFGNNNLSSVACSYSSDTYNQPNAWSFTYKSGTTWGFYFAQNYGSEHPTKFCY